MTPREYKDYRKAQQRCVRCGTRDEVTINGSPHCARCHEENKKYLKKRYQERRKLGLCVRCGHPAGWEGVLCDECRNKDKLRFMKRKATP